MFGRHKVKFEKVKIPDETDSSRYWTINEGDLQRVLLEECDKIGLEVITINISGCRCYIKVKGNKSKVGVFVIIMIQKYSHYVKNFRY